MTPLVSIVIPTLNRIARLRRCVEMVQRHVSVPFELIVVDGGSVDGTRTWLQSHQGLRVILEPEREGAVRAFNKGFRAAGGEFVMWLNDDAYPLPGSIESALRLFEHPGISRLGMAAFYHNWHQERNQLHAVEHRGESYEIYQVRGFPYANFGLLRRELLVRVGFLDERYYFFGADPDLALKIQIHAGLEVFGCPHALVHHDEHHDQRKVGDLPQGREDNEKLFAKWRLPAPGRYRDPRPDYLARIQSLGLLQEPVAWPTE